MEPPPPAGGGAKPRPGTIRHPPTGGGGFTKSLFKEDPNIKTYFFRAFHKARRILNMF
ncbi:MAG: hypothetical protein WC427_01500 [Candidatus Paceibacterota bacterium]